jgi:hypothetical protein
VLVDVSTIEKSLRLIKAARLEENHANDSAAITVDGRHVEAVKGAPLAAVFGVGNLSRRGEDLL